ncbi:MAG: WbuC family cupin fold metalloprotein [Gammaproteobacteria bacterium]|nr:WbuC family cupin fold metalloprotein [Gammaproteobacteria bacterium]
MLKQYTRGALEEAVKRAQNSARLRTNLNIHESAESSVQRLFLAFEPDTYIRPHRHPQAHKWELFIILEGEIDLLIFNDAGDVIDRIEMSANATPASSTRVVEIPPGIWHSYICKQTGSLAMEIKEGAYLPTAEADFLSMSPAENTIGVSEYYQWMKNAEPPQAM